MLDTLKFSELVPFFKWMYRGRYYAYDVPALMNALKLLVGTEAGSAIYSYSFYTLDGKGKPTDVIRSGKDVELSWDDVADAFKNQNRSTQMVITVTPADGKFFRRITVCSQYDKDGKHMYRVKSKSAVSAALHHAREHNAVMALLKQDPLKRKQIYDRTWLCQVERYLMALNDLIRRVTHGGWGPDMERFQYEVLNQLTLVNGLRKHKVEVDLRGAEDPYATMMTLESAILLNRREPTKEHLKFRNVLITENGVRYAYGLYREYKGMPYCFGDMRTEKTPNEFHELLGTGEVKLLTGPVGYIAYLLDQVQRKAIVEKREVLDLATWEVFNIEFSYRLLGGREFKTYTRTNDGTMYTTLKQLDKRMDVPRILNETNMDAIVHRTNEGKWGISHYGVEYATYLRSQLGKGTVSLTSDEFHGVAPHRSFASQQHETDISKVINDIPKPVDDQWLKDRLTLEMTIDETGQTWLTNEGYPPITQEGLNTLRAMIFRMGIMLSPNHRIDGWEDFEYIMQLVSAGLTKAVGDDQGVFSGHIGSRDMEPEIYRIPGDSWSIRHDDWAEWNACSNEVCAAKHQQDIIGAYDLTFTHDMLNKQDVNDVRWLLTAADVHMYKSVALEKYPKRHWFLVP